MKRYQLVPSNRPTSSWPAGALPVGFQSPATGRPLILFGSVYEITGVPASEEISQRNERSHLAVGRQLGEAVGGGRGGRSVERGRHGEIAGEILVAGEAQGVAHVAVRGVGVVRVPDEVAVGVDPGVAAAQVPISGRLSTVKRATKLPPGMPLPRGERRHAVGLGLALLSPSSWLPAGSLSRPASIGQRVAVVGQRRGEDELNGGRGRLSVDYGIVGDGHRLDGDDPIGVAGDGDPAVVEGQRVAARSLQGGRGGGRRRKPPPLKVIVGAGGIAVADGGELDARHDAARDRGRCRWPGR